MVTTVITADDFSVDPTMLARLGHAVPGIHRVLSVGTIAKMCATAAQISSPVVGIIGGDRSAAGLARVACKFAASATSGGLVVVAPAASCEVIATALLGGVKGWVFTQSPVEELITAIRAVAAGHLFVPSALLHGLANTVLMLTCQEISTQAGSELTSRELEVLQLLSLGAPNSEIARELFISEATVHSHVLSILRKMRARNRTEAVAMVYRRGIMPGRTAVPA